MSEPKNDSEIGEVDSTPAIAADTADEIEIDNTPKTPPVGAKSAAKKGKGNKKLKVPNFSSFRKKLIFGGIAALILIFGLIYGIFIAPSAKVTVKAQTKEIPLNFDFIADTKATEADIDGRTLRALNKETQKNETEKVEATGQKDKGNKASGTVSLRNCSQSDGKVTIPAGTGVSSGEFTFVTTQAVTLDGSVFSGGGTCLSSTKDVSVIAQQPGDKYNLSSRSYTVAGQSGVSAQGSAMSGGTTQIVKVVSQGDVDKAKERLNGKGNTVQEDMKLEFEKDGYLSIGDSFKVTPGAYNVAPAVDTEANEVTVSVTTTYQMSGVKEDDLKELIKKELGDSEEGKDQSVLSEGLSEAIIKPAESSGRLSDGQSAFNINTTVVTGPELNEQEIKQEIAGKKSGEAENILSARPGIESPKVELSPFWVNKVPKKHSKITIEVQQADGSEIPQ